MTDPHAHDTIEHLRKRIEDVKSAARAQIETCPMSDQYFRGMANGLAVAVSILTGDVPRLVDNPLPTVALGCVHGRLLGVPCPHCMGIGAATPGAVGVWSHSGECQPGCTCTKAASAPPLASDLLSESGV